MQTHFETTSDLIAVDEIIDHPYCFTLTRDGIVDLNEDHRDGRVDVLTLIDSCFKE